MAHRARLARPVRQVGAGPGANGDSAWSGLRVLLRGHLAGWCPSLVLLLPVGKGHQAPEQERNIPAEKGWGGVGWGRQDLLSLPWPAESTLGLRRYQSQRPNECSPPSPPVSPQPGPDPPFPKAQRSTSLPPAVGVTVAPVGMRCVPRDPILDSARTLRRPAHLSVPLGSAVPNPGSFLP